MKIAITGGIGSGKSAVGRVYKELGYPVFSCDEIYKDLIGDAAYLRAVGETFGEVFVAGGVLDKKKLAEKVFSDKESLLKLDALAHPLIMKNLLSRMEGERGLSFAEVPLLFEGHFESLFDKVIVVYRPLAARIGAVMARDGASKEEVLERIRNQADYETIIQEGYPLIINDGDEASLRQKAVNLLREW